MNPVKFGKTCLDQIKLKVNKPKKIRNEACQINSISKLEYSIKPFQNVFFSRHQPNPKYQGTESENLIFEQV